MVFKIFSFCHISLFCSIPTPKIIKFYLGEASHVLFSFNSIKEKCGKMRNRRFSAFFIFFEVIFIFVKS